jgi:pyridoxamine 5'-phosphate oxidase
MTASPLPLAGEVLGLVTEWLPANDEPVRPQMQVATVDADGLPDIRTVLLSEWTDEGFAFHTDASSQKAVHLAAHPVAALDFTWPAFSRQLVVRGPVVVTDEAEQAAVYAERSPYLQQLAWQNTAELAALPRDERVAAWAAFRSDHGGSLMPAPSWTGFRVRPLVLKFWTPDTEGPSHRVQFRAIGGAWERSELPG